MNGDYGLTKLEVKSGKRKKTKIGIKEEEKKNRNNKAVVKLFIMKGVKIYSKTLTQSFGNPVNVKPIFFHFFWGGGI